MDVFVTESVGVNWLQALIEAGFLLAVILISAAFTSWWLPRRLEDHKLKNSFKAELNKLRISEWKQIVKEFTLTYDLLYEIGFTIDEHSNGKKCDLEKLKNNYYEYINKRYFIFNYLRKKRWWFNKKTIKAMFEAQQSLPPLNFVKRIEEANVEEEEFKLTDIIRIAETSLYKIMDTQNLAGD